MNLVGRSKQGHPRRTRPEPTPLARLAAAYRCGHCTAQVTVDEARERVVISHDESCPVLRRHVSAAGDAFRAAIAAGDSWLLFNTYYDEEG